MHLREHLREGAHCSLLVMVIGCLAPGIPKPIEPRHLKQLPLTSNCVSEAEFFFDVVTRSGDNDVLVSLPAS
jgi:hypothetical protein